jgi:hypothetical protein
VLHPARLRKTLLEFLLRRTDRSPASVEHDGAGGRRALIESENEPAWHGRPLVIFSAAG